MPKVMVRSMMVAGFLMASLLTGCGPTPPADPVPMPFLEENALLPQASERCETAFAAPVSGGAPEGYPLYLNKRAYESPAAWKVVDYPHQARLNEDVGFLVCIQETRTEVGEYSSKSTAYRKEWVVRIVDWQAGTVFTEGMFQGEAPPLVIAISEGEEELEAYYGDSPYTEFITWFTSNPQGGREFLYAAEELTDFEISSAGDLAAYGSEEHLFLADLKTLSIEADLVQDEWIRSIAISPDGGTVVFSTGTQLSILDVPTQQALAQPQGEVGQITFSADGNWMATSLGGTLVAMWDMQAVEKLGAFIPHMGMDVLALRFSADGRRLATIGEDNFVRLWDVTTGQQIFEADLERTPRLLAFSPDGGTLAARSDGNPIIFWDTETLQETGRIEPGFWVLWMAFSPDGELVALSGDDQSRSVWSVNTFDEVIRLSGFAEQGGRAGGMAFSPDGSLLAGISGYAIRLWDTAMWEERPPLAGHNKAVETLTFTPDGRQLITSSRDGTIRVWDLIDLP